MIHSAEDVLFTEPREIPNAYVLYDDATGRPATTVMRFLAARASDRRALRQWEYSSMEDALLGGRAAAEQVERA